MVIENEMTELVEWLELNMEQCGRLEVEALSRGHNATVLQWNNRYAQFQEVLDFIRVRIGEADGD